MKDRYILCLTHADPRRHAAGLEKYLADEAALLADRGMSVVCLFPFPTKRSKRLNRHLSRYWGVLADGKLQGFFDVKGVVGLVAGWQRIGKVPVEIQLHQMKDWDLSQIQHVVGRIPVDVRLFLHDYFTICPQYNLLKNNTAFCGDTPPSEQKCGDCCWWTPGHLGAMQSLLETVGRRLTVTAPSETARRIWEGSFPLYASQAEVVPHLIPAGDVVMPRHRKREDEMLRIAFVGAPAAHKGWPVFSRLVQELAQANPGYEFYHFGRPAGTPGSVIQIPVSFIREGPHAMTAAIRQQDIDLVLLWSIWPETYSYTLQESRLAGTMIITNPDSGNIAATIQHEGGGRISPDEQELLAYLQDIARVRREVNELRAQPVRGTVRMEPNPAIADALAAKPVSPLRMKGGPARRCRHVEALYGIKRLKRKWWDRET